MLQTDPEVQFCDYCSQQRFDCERDLLGDLICRACWDVQPPSFTPSQDCGVVVLLPLGSARRVRVGRVARRRRFRRP
jgi:hypothetical protein